MTGTESAQAAAKRCGWRDSGRRMGATRRLCGPNLYHHDNLDNVISSDLSQVVVIVLGKVLIEALHLSFFVFKFMLVPPTWNSAKAKVVASHRLALPAAARKMAHEESVTSITPPQSYMCKYVEVERSRYRSAECLAQYFKLFSIRMMLSAKLKIHRHIN